MLFRRKLQWLGFALATLVIVCFLLKDEASNDLMARGSRLGMMETLVESLITSNVSTENLERLIDFQRRLSVSDGMRFRPQQKSKVFFPWINSSRAECRRQATFLAEMGSTPPILLASYPGSGNTWVRSLIEGMSGIFTGSKYMDYSINQYMLGESANMSHRTTFVVKTHRFMDPKIFPYEKAVVIVRNPFEAILSFFNFLSFSGGSHTDTRTSYLDNLPRWRSFSNNAIKQLREFNGNLTTQTVPVHVIVYEKLRSDMVNELVRLAKFLNINVDPIRFDCLLNNAEGKFRRPASTSTMLFPFFKANTTAVVETTCQLYSSLLKHNVHLPLDKYESILASKFYAMEPDHPMPDFSMCRK